MICVIDVNIRYIKYLKILWLKICHIKHYEIWLDLHDGRTLKLLYFVLYTSCEIVADLDQL